ncbi:unnamed protein product [Sympodiomycopsis kandeliae]
MASFVRDRDDEFVTSGNTPTAASGSTWTSTATPPPPETGSPASGSRPSSVSPQKKRRWQDTTNAKENESLLKRMGGPSAAKAGLGKDQDEINRTIYEASKGSKYFENERKNDARITKKVEAMLERLDERLRAVPRGSPEWTTIEKKANAMLARVETTRDLTRHIVHCDLDMFYAAVELKRDPSLKGKAFGVGKGVLVTASYEARKFGVRSGMAAHIAYALCPHLITVPNDMRAYVEASQQIMSIFRRFDDNMAQASLDEAYLDITNYCEENEVAVDEAVADLRRQVREETELTVSVGVAPNKMLAKIGSDKNKPDGQYLLESSKEACLTFMKDLPIRKIPGVGRVTERMLQSIGVETCQDIWKLRVEIALVLGDGSLEWLLKYYLGIASSIVEPGKREERKSVGREHTFKPTSDVDQLFELLKQSSQQVEKDLKHLDFVGKKVTLICKYDNFQRFTRDQTQDRYVSSFQDIYKTVKSLLEHELKVQPGLTLRLIGARVGTLKDIRKPEDGGPLKKFWANQSDSRRSPGKKSDVGLYDHDNDAMEEMGIPSAQPRKSSSEQGGDQDGDADADLEENAEDKALRLAIAASLQDYDQHQAQQQQQADSVAHPTHQSPSPSETNSDDLHLSPVPERSATELAEALYRSAPEVIRPPSKRKRQVDDAQPIQESADLHERDQHQSKNKSAPSSSWLTSQKASTIVQSSGPKESSPSEVPSQPICPICSQPVPIRFGSTLTGRNAQLNQHIDRCLSTSTEGGKSNSQHRQQRDTQPTASSGRGRGGALDRFFKQNKTT